VARPGPKAADLPAVVAGPAVVETAREIGDLFAAFVAASPDRWPAAEADVVAPLRALATPEGRRSAAGIGAIARLADHMDERSDAARAARLRAGDDQISPPDPVTAIQRIDQADFHQVVGLVLGHPLLARRVGLRLDATIPAFTGTRTLRAVRADGTPLSGPVATRQPWSRVVADPAARRFVMVPQPGAPTEVVDGMLDLDGAGDGLLVTTTDVVGVALQLDALARSRLAPGQLREGEPVPLPVLRDTGFTLARANRGVEVAGHAMGRAGVLDPAEPGGDIVLFADDVTTGHRLEVATDGGPFRSLMRRRSTYTVGTTTFGGEDEGRVEALPVLAAPSASGDGLALLAGEDIAGWDGWPLGVPRPGRAVLGDGPGAPPAVDVEPEIAPGYDLRHEVAVIPGSAPKLRFGRRYEFRAPAVDLAGNSLTGAPADRSHSVDAGHYLRRELLPSPELVPRRRFSFGESQAHLVVRSTGHGERVGDACERHVVLPKGSEHLAESHGRLDEAFGPGVPPAVRDRMLALASRESATFLDPTVPGPDGTPVPTPGLAIVTNDPAVVPDVTLPLPAGEPLPNGVYAIHDTDRMGVGYLPDPMAGGVSLLGLPDHPDPVVVPATGPGWPDLVPTRLVVRPRLDGDTTTTSLSAGGQVLTVDLPPATKAQVELASTVDPDVLDQVDLGGHAPAELLDGTAITRCARQTVALVHAVAQPLADPTLPGGPQLGTLGQDATSVAVGTTVGYHPASTGEVHVRAEWTDVVDTGSGPVETRPRSATLGSKRVTPAGGATAALDGPLELGDTRRHDVTFRPVATSAFREYFDPRTEPTRAGAPVTVSVKNRSRPPAPAVHSVVPLWRWTRSTSAGVYKATRQAAGVRVVLDRPWDVTGDGERLGVVVYRTSADATSAGGIKLRELVTRWGTDPLQETQPQATEHLLANRFGGQSDLAGAVTLPDGPAPAPGVPIPKVDVVAYPVSFDPERNRWVADVQFSALGLPESAWPFLRLALVRFQPQSVTGCHLSPVTIAPFVQVPPTRSIEARREGAVGVRVKVTGAPVAGTTFTVRQERRIPEPSVRSLDLGVDAGAGWHVKPVTGTGLANLVLEPVGAVDPASLGALLDGRVVVEETETGLALRRNQTIQRIVFTETFDRAAVGMQGVPSASRA
jgi:hypothetical protein